MPPKSTLWKLEPHTMGKHLVLANYLNAWFPILGKWNGRILFIDGFAGPGRYEKGEDGSPIIALKALKDHRAKDRITAEVNFLFIEKDVDRANYLESLVTELRPSLPRNCSARVEPTAFDEKLIDVLNQLDNQAQNLAPCFVMIDPFGVSDTPIAVVERILRNPKSEVYISFMYEFIDRFKDTPEFESHLDQLFGTDEWRPGLAIEDSDERARFFFDLYERQLRRAGAKYVVRFDLYEGNRLIYAIFFGTKNLVGCDRMKQAIWKVVPFGDFAFRGARAGQLSLDLRPTDLQQLRDAMTKRFQGKGWIGIEEVRDFVASDETDYHTGQFKSVLVSMENDGQIIVDEKSRKKKRTYPDGTRIKFI